MNSRVGKRQRRVAEAESALVNNRLALGAQLRMFGGDFRAAATPRRVLVGGLVLGALAGLLTGRRKPSPGAQQPAPKPGVLQSLTGMVRLVSMAMPMLGPLMAMAQGTVPGPATPPPAAPDPATAPPDPLA